MNEIRSAYWYTYKDLIKELEEKDFMEFHREHDFRLINYNIYNNLK